jgi:hypothetical protein
MAFAATTRETSFVSFRAGLRYNVRASAPARRPNAGAWPGRGGICVTAGPLRFCFVERFPRTDGYPVQLYLSFFTPSSSSASARKRRSSSSSLGYFFNASRFAHCLPPRALPVHPQPDGRIQQRRAGVVPPRIRLPWWLPTRTSLAPPSMTVRIRQRPIAGKALVTILDLSRCERPSYSTTWGLCGAWGRLSFRGRARTAPG